MQEIPRKFWRQRARLFLLFLTLFSPLFAQHIEVGYAGILDTGLPIEPQARFSYSQQIIYPAEIGFQGTITKISFHYRFVSQTFFDSNRDWRIFLAHTDQDVLTDWINAAELDLVFDAQLQQEWFLGGLSGEGWLQIPLNLPFDYDGARNLIIAVDQNTNLLGHSSDDFYAWNCVGNRARKFISLSENPDPYAPPESGSFLQAVNHLRLTFSGGTQSQAPRHLYGYATGQSNRLFWTPPPDAQPLRYIINRDGQNLATTTDSHFEDHMVAPQTDYLYSVQAELSAGTISPPSSPYLITTPAAGISSILFESFENRPAFSTELGSFINLDLDASPNWAFPDTDFPGEGEALGWMVFSPERCTPPLEMPSYVSGAQFLISMACMQPPNNDWLISPSFFPGEQAKLVFLAGRLSNAYGSERIRVLISTTGAQPSDFFPLHAASYLIVENAWQEFEFDLSAFAEQDVRFAINCCSLDAHALYIDHIQVFGSGGYLGISDSTPAFARPYPNPARHGFTFKDSDLFDISIYNLRGQKIHGEKRVREFDGGKLDLSPGIYLLKVESQDRAHTFRQVILPR